MCKEPLLYLKHIQDECNFILSIKNDSLTYEHFIQNEIFKRAIVRSLEIIGEASKKILPEYKNRWTGIEWKNMMGMRDRLIHNYMGVNYSIVWDVIQNKIPELAIQIQKVLDDNDLISP